MMRSIAWAPVVFFSLLLPPFLEAAPDARARKVTRAVQLVFPSAPATTSTSRLVPMNQKQAELSVRLLAKVSGKVSPSYTGASYGAVVREYEEAIADGENPDELSQAYYCLGLQYVGAWGKAGTCLDDLGERLRSRVEKMQDDSCGSLWGGVCVSNALVSSMYHIARSREALAVADFASGVAYAREAASVVVYSGKFNKGGIPWALSQHALALALDDQADAARDAANDALKALDEIGKLRRSGAADDTFFNLSATYISLGDGRAAWETAQRIGTESALSKVILATGAIGGTTLAVLGGPALLAAVTMSGMARQGAEMDRLWKHGADVRRMFVSARSALAAGEFDVAKRFYGLLRDDLLVQAMAEIYPAVLEGSARVALHEGDTDAAIEYYRGAIEVVESARASFQEEAGRMGFVLDKQGLYLSLVDILVREGRHEDAFAYVERAKARALIDLLASRVPALAENETEDTRRTIRTLEQGMEAIGSFNPALAGDVLQRTRAVIIEESRQLARSVPAIASLVAVSSPDVAAIRTRLAADERLVEFFGSDANWYAFVVSRDRVRGVQLQLKQVPDQVAEYREALQDPGSLGHEALGSALYRVLLGPVGPFADAHRLTIVPHGALHYIPWSALPVGGQYLVDRFALRTLPVAGILPLLPEHRGGSRMLMLGNPDLADPGLDLPGAQREVEAIHHSRMEAVVRVRSDASESFLKREAGGYDILHIASHGIFDSSRPLDSALLLARDSTEDGRLTVGELYGLNLHADIVTLSACETGLGAIAGGDDVVGLSRGLFYAGASSVIASLWQVDDIATAGMMVALYSSPSSDWAERLRTAQQWVRQGGHEHPYYWAPFQLSGRWGSDEVAR